MQLVVRAPTPEDTRAVGGALAPLLRPRDVVVLTGELGAGKTTFVQGVAKGLGITDQVVSPTFTLIREYSGRLEVAHVDVYRLDRVQDVMDLGLDELGQGDDLLLIEWGDVVEELLAEDRLRVELTTTTDEERRVALRGAGSSWAERWEQVELAVEPWSAPA
jgi:tRNA threonylcarbamoyladenosine biosynthesis protein TsaE